MMAFYYIGLNHFLCYDTDSNILFSQFLISNFLLFFRGLTSHITQEIQINQKVL